MNSPRLGNPSRPAPRQPAKTGGESKFAVPFSVAAGTTLAAATFAGIKIPGKNLELYLKTRGVYRPQMSPSIIRQPIGFVRDFFRQPKGALQSYLHLGHRYKIYESGRRIDLYSGSDNFVSHLPSLARDYTGGTVRGTPRIIPEIAYANVISSGKKVEKSSSGEYAKYFSEAVRDLKSARQDFYTQLDQSALGDHLLHLQRTHGARMTILSQQRTIWPDPYSPHPVVINDEHLGKFVYAPRIVPPDGDMPGFDRRHFSRDIEAGIQRQFRGDPVTGGRVKYVFEDFRSMRDNVDFANHKIDTSNLIINSDRHFPSSLSLNHDVQIIEHALPPRISAELAEQLASIPATAKFRSRYGRFVDPLHAFAEDVKILRRDTKIFNWLGKVGRFARGIPRIIPVLGRIVVLGVVAMACAQTVQAYAEDGKRVGPRTWRQLGEGSVDLTNLISLDVTGYTEGVLRHYVRNGIAALQKKGYLGGNLLEKFPMWRQARNPFEIGPEKPIFDKPFRLPRLP